MRARRSNSSGLWAVLLVFWSATSEVSASEIAMGLQSPEEEQQQEISRKITSSSSSLRHGERRIQQQQQQYERNLEDSMDDFGFRHEAHNTQQIQTRIVGGSIADADDYPYNVNMFGCGGALVAKDIIMTAAHCQYLNPWSVLIGGSTALTGEIRYIEYGSATPHPSYNSNDQNFDIMLYKLSRNSGRKPVVLNEAKANPVGEQALRVLGFGSTQENEPGSVWLREVTVNHVNHKACKDAYKGFAGQVDPNTMVCAGVDGGGKDSCQGDSGGPLVDPTTGQIVGITSWGNGCGQDGFPGVYARVSDFVPWLKDEICRMSDNPLPSYLGECPKDSGNNNNNNNSDNSGSSGNGFWDWLTSLFQL